MEIITTHKNVDFDALASVFAAAILYPEATPVLPRSLNPNTRAFLSFHKDLLPYVTSHEIEPEKISRLIVVDTNRWDRLDGFGSLKTRSDIEIHLWDHHDIAGDIVPAWSCCQAIGATVSLLTGELADRHIDLTPVKATLFVAGIYEDTGNMTFPATSVQDTKAVGYLLEQQADLGLIGSFLRPVYGPKQKDILFEMLKTAERLTLNGRTVSINTVGVEGHTPGLALVVNMYQDIMNVEAAFGIFADRKRNQCMVIGRSSGENIDIGTIMGPMGGGGHTNAGSAKLKSVDPDAVRKWIVDSIEGDQPGAVQISDLMSFPVFTTSPETSMRDAALILRETGSTGIPVVEGDTVVGILSRRDFKRMKPSQFDSPVKSFMSRKVLTIDPRTRLGEVAQLMVGNDVGRLPVIEAGKLVGIVTRSDVMEYYYDLLPGELSHDRSDSSSLLPE